jgi:hypothetical protein
VVVGWSENPIMQRPMTAAEFLESGHVAVRISNQNTFIERALENLSETRRIEVTAPSFLQAPWLLPGTMRLALMHERLARIVAPNLSLAIAECPVPLPVMSEMMQYHATRSKDAALVWLRSKLLEIARRSG